MADIRSVAVGSTTVAANFNRNVVYYPNASATAANPFSQFGTRQLALLKINHAAAGTFTAATFGDADSATAKAIRGLQTMAEVWFVTRIDDNNLGVIVSADTVTNGDTKSGGAVDSGTGYGLVEAAINASTGYSDITITTTTLA
jgi:hypothetical protein